MPDQYTRTEERTTAKSRTGSRTDPFESLGSTSKAAPRGQGTGFREWALQRRAKGDIFHPTKRNRVDQACAHKRRHVIPGCWSSLCSMLLNMDLVILFWVGMALLPPIVSVAGGAGVSCFQGHLLCHSLPVKSLTQLRVNKDQATTPFSLGTNSLMATSKANSSNGVDFIVNLARSG